MADDYILLSSLASGRSLDFFSPMGAAYYWRPVSRQLYFLLVGPWLLRAPWLAPLLAALLLLALYAVLYRLARADSLLQANDRISGPTGAYWVLRAMLAQQRGDQAGAADAVRRCLAIDPKNGNALRLARELGIIPRDP